MPQRTRSSWTNVQGWLVALGIAAAGVACGGASDDPDGANSGSGSEEELGTASQGLSATDSMPVAGTTIVGTTPGSLSVTRLGQSSYSIPITVAPGPGGMQPKLSLEYSSDGADGVFGVGFTMSGLSGITRCAKTTAQDGSPDPIRWDYGDRFCLDGQRLIAVSGAYGADGTEYRTEIESFSKIVSRGAANGGPTHFEVFTREGRVMVYGATEDSRVEKWQAPQVHRWLVNRVTDRIGNGYDVTYFEQNGSSTAVPTAIYSFGANAVRTGQSVQFVYEARPDVKTVFQAGNFFRPHHRMTQLITRDGANVVRTYKFTYDAGASGGRTRLTALTECGANDVCYAPTRFTWSTPSFSYDRRWFGGGGQGGLLTGDFNGDGKADLFTWWNGDWRGWVNTSNGTSFAGWQEKVWDMPPQRMPVVADMNGDGKSDLVTAYTDGSIFVWLSNGSGFAGRQTWAKRSDLFGALFPTDVNGDGKADLVSRAPGRLDVWTSTGSGLAWLGSLPVSGEVSFGDFDADGRSDLMEIRDNQVFVRASTGGGFAAEVWWGTLMPGARQFTDMNGDGATDVVVRDGGGVSHVYWSAGDKLVYTQPYASVGEKDLFLDLNGDGKADVLGFSEGVIRAGFAMPHSIGFDHIPHWSQWFGANEGPAKGFRLDSRWLTPTGAWLNSGGDFYWESSTCQELGYPTDNASFECGYRWGNVDGVNPRQDQVCYGGGEAGDWCSTQCVDEIVTYRSDGGGGSSQWSPAMDYTAQQVNCRDQCTAWCGGGESGDWCCGTGTICDTQWCNAGGCTMSPSRPGPWLESSQYRANGGWSDVLNGQVHDARCDLAVPAGQDCGGNGYSAYVGKVNALHCQSAAKPVAADVNGDGLIDVVEVDGSGNFWVDVAVGRGSDVILKINDGIGQEHQIDYVTIVDGDPLYSRATEFAISPVGHDVEVVKQIRSSDGVGGMRAVSYAYEGGNIDARGRGFLGFHKVTSTDHATGHVTVKTFHGGFPATGTESWEGTYVGGVLVRATDHQTSWTAGPPYVLTRTLTQEWSNELDGSPTRYVRTTYGPYAYGFPSTITVETKRSSGDASEVVSSSTTNTYAHDASAWILGRLTRAVVTKSRTGAPSETRTSSFSYQPANGLLESETVEPEDAALRMTTTHAYDLFGNRVSSTETSGALSRTVTRTYDASGRFPIRETNAQGHATAFQYDGRFGSVTKVTDPNGLVTTSAFDPMGRKIGETLPDGRVTSIYFEKPATGSDPTTAAMVTRTVTSELGTTRVVADLLGRTVRKTVDGFGGRAVHIDTGYGATGLKVRESRPYFAGDVRYDHVFAYDAVGRETSATSPDAKTVLFAHKGRTVTEVDPRGFVKTKTETVDGKPWTVSEVVGGRTLTLAQTYDVHGQLLTATDPKGIKTTTTYDKRGRRTSITETNAGKRTFTVDGFGRTTREVDAKGQRTDFTVDGLDRVTRRIERDAAATIVRDTTFTFDTSVVSGTTKKILGALAVSAVKELKSGVLTTSTRRTLTYDTLARPTGETKLVEGTTLKWSRAYDASTGRVASLTYPGILTTAGLSLFLEYDAAGRVIAVRRGSTTGLVVWRANGADASGAITVETLESGLVTTRTFDPLNGQLKSVKTPRKDGLSCVPAACTPDMSTWNVATGRDAKGCFYNPDSARNEKLPSGCTGETPQDMEFVFDVMGNLTQRKDKVTGLLESFQYDALDRLTGVNGPAPRTLAYDDAGNIVSKSDFGTYAYDPARGHLVTSVTKAGATLATYTYDANGNMITGAGRDFTWTTFNKPSRIAAGAASVDFVYDDGNQLAAQRSASGGLTIFGEDFELQTKPDGSRERRTLVKIGGLVRAVHRATVAAGATTETSAGLTLLLHDHLGSTSVVTDGTGQVAQRLSYDAHGKRRFTIGTDDPGGILRGKITDKGFTGHQMLEDLGLVFMGARVYDPMLGRFVSADLVVQSTQDVNGLNRYVYGGNNPISVIDPSGHFFKKLWKAIRSIFTIVVRIVLAVVTAVVAVYAPYLLPVVAIAAGAINGAITGGIKGALIGAVTAGITMGIGAIGSGIENELAYFAFKSVAHGLVGGAASAAMGGSFVHGFVAGFMHGAGEPAIDFGQTVFERVAISAAIGGAASKLAGGSFQNGAMSGAFAQLFNGELSRALRTWAGPKPDFHVNPKHLQNRPGVSPQPNDALAAYMRAVPDPLNVDPQFGTPRQWFGMNRNGDIYRFSVENVNPNGSGYQMHFSGVMQRSDVPHHVLANPRLRPLMPGDALRLGMELGAAQSRRFGLRALD